MERLTQQDLLALFECLQEWYAPRDREAFLRFTLTALPKVVRAETTTYAEFDLRQHRMTFGLAEPIDPRMFSDLPIYEQHMTEHPRIMHYHRIQDEGALKVSDFLTPRQFHRLGLYNEYFRGLGVEDLMAIPLPAPPPLARGFGLFRGRRDFSERERLLLNLLRPHLAQAYANAQAVTAMQQELTLWGQASEMSGQGVVVLTKEGQVRLMTPRARGWLAAYFGRPPA